MHDIVLNCLSPYIVVVHNLECLGRGWMLCSPQEFYLPSHHHHHHRGKDRQKWYVCVLYANY